MKNKVLLSAALMLGITGLNIPHAKAGTGDFGAAVKAGTLGIGIEATVGLTETINTRFGANAFSYDWDGTESNVDYDFEGNLRTLALLFDWHPGGGGFRLSAGAMYNGNEGDATGKPGPGGYNLNGQTYTAAQVGTLTGNIDFDSFAPYLGIGYGNSVGKDKKWSFVFDLGVMYQGSASVSIQADGTLSTNQVFKDNLEAERQDLENELDGYKWYPVAMLGVSYKF